MNYVFKISENDLAEYKDFIPEAYLKHYQLGESILFYGLGYEDSVCGAAVLELRGNEILVLYMNVMNEYVEYLQDFILSLKYDLCTIADRMVWKFIEESSLWELLTQCGFVVSKDDIAMFDFSISALSDIKILNEAAKNVIPLSGIDNVTLKKFFDDIAEAGEDIVEAPRIGQEYLDECSAIYIEKDVPEGIMLVKDNKSDGLVIPYMFSASNNPMAIVEMMRFALQQARTRFDDSTICKAYIIEPVLVSIVERLTGIKGKYQCRGTYQLDGIRDFSGAYKNIDI